MKQNKKKSAHSLLFTENSFFLSPLSNSSLIQIMNWLGVKLLSNSTFNKEFPPKRGSRPPLQNKNNIFEK